MSGFGNVTSGVAVVVGEDSDVSIPFLFLDLPLLDQKGELYASPKMLEAVWLWRLQ